MSKIAFFGHDAGDAAIRRRAIGFEDAGYEVSGFMMRREEDKVRDWANVDLGQTFDANYVQRLRAILKGAKVALAHRSELKSVSLIYARNLDMLLCALLVKKCAKLDVPVIYECLDVHHLLTRQDVFGVMFRSVERYLIKRTDLLVYSSPAFEKHFFQKYYKKSYTPYLLENRIVFSGLLPERKIPFKKQKEILRIGWFGVLRCNRSLHLLATVAKKFPKKVEIIARGIPAETQVPEFNNLVSSIDNFKYEGAYEAPADLQSLYAQVDVVWAGDFYQAGYNSKWLLPNRIYEGGYFCVPAIAPEESQTGQWIKDHKAGFTVVENLEQNLPLLVEELLKNRAAVESFTQNLKSIPDSTFIQPVDELNGLLDPVLQKHGKR